VSSRYVSPDSTSIERAWPIGNRGASAFVRRFNVLPETRVPILRNDRGGLYLIEARWGFVPPWWKQPTPPRGCIDAKAEDAADKPMWRHAYRSERCLIPADGWYAWAGPRQPHFIFRPEGPVCFAGLMSLWKLDGQLPLITCAILTRAASTALSHIHPRMPVVLPSALFADWLDPKVAEPDPLIAQAIDEFSHYPVTPDLAEARHDEEALVLPL
jgi:putative SOS response-associated peptidase YedK